jgi:hypothetical protein
MSPRELVHHLEREAAEAVAAFNAARSAPSHVPSRSARALSEAWRARCIALYRLSWARLALSATPNRRQPTASHPPSYGECTEVPRSNAMSI